MTPSHGLRRLRVFLTAHREVHVGGSLAVGVSGGVERFSNSRAGRQRPRHLRSSITNSSCWKSPKPPRGVGCCRRFWRKSPFFGHASRSPSAAISRSADPLSSDRRQSVVVLKTICRRSADSLSPKWRQSHLNLETTARVRRNSTRFSVG